MCSRLALTSRHWLLKRPRLPKAPACGITLPKAKLRSSKVCACLFPVCMCMAGCHFNDLIFRCGHCTYDSVACAAAATLSICKWLFMVTKYQLHFGRRSVVTDREACACPGADDTVLFSFGARSMQALAASPCRQTRRLISSLAARRWPRKSSLTRGVAVGCARALPAGTLALCH